MLRTVRSEEHTLFVPAIAVSVALLLADALLRLAAWHDTVIRMERGVGDFIAASQTIASAAAPQDPQQLAARLPRLYHLASFRTVYQDAAFASVKSLTSR